jgi:serine/threonine-protein kinase
MPQDTWVRIEAILSEALELEPEQRPAFLDGACPNAAVRREVESLLEADAYVAEEGFMEKPVEAGEQLLQWVSAQAAGASLVAGDTVDAYRIVRPLGRGGMGVVYLAERADGHFEQQVALKVIKRGMDTDEVLRRFHDERQILATLDHPHIARLFDGGVTDDGLPYFAMEYVEGRPIDAYCNEQQLSVADRLRLFQTVCDAVQYAHRNLVVHRDLKPSNVLVTEDGTVKLLDFGIAKALDPDARAAPAVTQRANRRLTPEYAAPEQVLGDPVTTATDVYALGIILYELLTGHRPYQFRSRRMVDIESAICERVPERPSTVARRTRTQDGTTITPEVVSQQRATVPAQLRKALSGDLDAITMKALMKEPERRYASADEFRTDVEHYLQGRPVAAQPSTFRYRASKFVRRHKVAFAAACIAVVALVGGASVALWQASVAQREAQRASQEAATSSAALDALVTTLTEVNPVEGRGVTFTARDLVDAGLSGLQDLEEKPRLHATMMNALGRVSRGVGFIDLADSLHTRALAIQRETLGPEHPDVAESLVRIGQVRAAQGQPDAAEEAYRSALAVDPQQVSARMDLGILLFHQGRFDETIAQFETAIEQAPDNPRLHSNLGSIHYYLGHWDEARQMFERSIALRPTYAAYANLATMSYYVRGDYAEAARMYEQALKLNEGDYTVWGYLAAAYHWSGQQAAADSTFRRAIDMAETHLADVNPDDPAAHAELASYHAMLGQEAEARAHAARALDLAPREATVLYTVGHAYEQVGQRERALDLLGQAVAAGQPLSDLQQEPGLQALREDPRFQRIQAQAEADA